MIIPPSLTDRGLGFINSNIYVYIHIPHYSCVICMDNFELSQCVKTLAPCQHDFHSTCIDRWLKVSDPVISVFV